MTPSCMSSVEPLHEYNQFYYPQGGQLPWSCCVENIFAEGGLSASRILNTSACEESVSYPSSSSSSSTSPFIGADADAAGGVGEASIPVDIVASCCGSRSVQLPNNHVQYRRSDAPPSDLG